jgi:hypothetical protein
MYPIPKLARQIIEEWSNDLAAHFNCTKEVVLGCNESWISFPMSSVRIELLDESFVEFRYAFYIVNEEKRAIAVFTEHCGHFILPYHDAKVFVDGALRYEQNA